MDGIVKSFSPEHGFGFITPLIGKPKETPDVYFHITAVRGGMALPAGARVSFVLVASGDGKPPQAANVVVKQERLRRTDGTECVSA